MCVISVSHWMVCVGYISCMRVTTASGATGIMSGKHLQVYFDFRVVVWLTVVGLGLTGKVARLLGQSHQCQSQATLSTVALLRVISGLYRVESCYDLSGYCMVHCRECICCQATGHFLSSEQVVRFCSLV